MCMRERLLEIYCGCKVRYCMGRVVFLRFPWVSRSGALEEHKEGVEFVFVVIPDLILGNGSTIRFLDDVWCEEMPFKKAFIVLYGIACDKDALVASHLVSKSGSFRWDVSFIRAATAVRWMSWFPYSRCCIPLE